MGEDWKNWKDGKYDNRYSGNRRRNKNNNKIYGILSILGIVIVSIVLINQNYDVSVNNQQLSEIIPLESIEKSIDDISKKITINEIKNTINEVSDSIPIKIELKSTQKGSELTLEEIQSLRADWMANRFNEKYRNLEMNCPNHPLKPGYFVIGGDDKINDAIFERCILP